MASFPALARRTGGAAVALAVVLAAIVPDWPHAVPTFVLAALAAFAAGMEIAGICHGSPGRLRRIPAGAATAVSAFGFAFFPDAAAWFLLLPGLVYSILAVLEGRPTGSIASVAGAGWMSMFWAAGLGSIARLRAASPEPWLALLPLVCCWAGDTAAYFAGCAFGKHKLSPTISPAKSVEGLWAGLAVSTGAALLVGSAGGLSAGPFVMAACGLVCGLAAVHGDLLESAFKRDAGVKDSGVFLPGHGGVLDRTDSIVAAAPAVLLMLMAAGIVS
ncbi:MAG TPA: phosphatidate cytidylyltransferase [Candidatus Fermentibacter daniensis]|jgi:phosphatidate cytidylyltransferase|nr:MAG: hypothetical protein AO396_03605 [Candidatus Fermentibacter daniensis]MBP7719115.1 phosphatidate cytidylyltransferase [Candidatus Fermentibacter sp.]KZD17955.1 MAG: hypothetical protein AO395_00375 [Candidatus Fermentibacter daniensis]KZD19680.1 MAG: hypothetical protein AO394_01975 [Candidatus Fermentibacter daniensis]MCC6871504.1 phosphatidate cytidylyltransferase [Candidatus Fermentibacter sp.]